MLFTIYCNGQRADLLSLDEIARRDVHDGGCQDAGGEQAGIISRRLLSASSNRKSSRGYSYD